jgi:hypothetical protein
VLGDELNRLNEEINQLRIPRIVIPKPAAPRRTSP